MASGYKSNQVDLDNIFQPRGSATPVANTGYNVAGVDISQRYAPRTTPPVPATGFKTAGVDLNQVFNGVIAANAVGGFIVYPSASLAASVANTLPWRIGGTLYTSYPSGLLFDSGTVVQVTCPVDAIPASVNGIFGLVALTAPVSSGGVVLGTSFQPSSWTTSDSNVTYFDVPTITSALPDSGPPYYAGAQCTTTQNTANIKTFTANTQQSIPTPVTAVIDIRTPGYQYTFIDYPANGQTVASGISPVVFNAISGSVSGTMNEVNGLITACLNGTSVYTVSGLNCNLSQVFLASPGPLSGATYTSNSQVITSAPNITYSVGANVISQNNIFTGTVTPNPAQATLTMQITSLYTGTDYSTQAVTESIITVVDTNNSTVALPTIKTGLVSGIIKDVSNPAGHSYSSTTGWPSSLINGVFPPGTSASSGSNLQIGTGNIVMNRKRVLVT